MKKTWNTPKVTIYGSVENLTQKKSKYFGGKTDGYWLSSNGTHSVISDYTSM